MFKGLKPQPLGAGLYTNGLFSLSVGFLLTGIRFIRCRRLYCNRHGWNTAFVGFALKKWELCACHSPIMALPRVIYALSFLPPFSIAFLGM
jgi:hypothetical protein